MKATFVYPNSRVELLAGIERGEEPDSTLHGALYLGEHGIDVEFHDPLLTRRPLPKALSQVAWNVRELTVPYELGRTDVVFTPLAAFLPLAAHGRRLPVVVINFGLNLIWRRASRARRVLLRRSLCAAARIICLGEAQRTELVADAGLEPERVLTMPIPVDDRFFTPQADAGTRSTLSLKIAAQGPVALINTRAVAPSRRPLTSKVSRHSSPRSAPTQRVRVRIAAPRSAASSALSTTRRASSVWQSEYSKPVR